MRGRPIGPFLFASIVGVVSGVYIFEPLFKEIAEKYRNRRRSERAMQLAGVRNAGLVKTFRVVVALAFTTPHYNTVSPLA
ncbi:rrna-processing protein utp23 [Moniliophthora roreri]|nr:rrna-processing protein utp23 [Moniliophthora roreri]